MPVTTPPDNSHQREFDAKYITVAEVRRLADNAAPSTIMIARRSGMLPGAIACNGAYVWEREALQPFLAAFIERHSRNKIVYSPTKWNSAENRPA